MVYKNILMRQQALFERDPKVQKQFAEDAEKLLQEGHGDPEETDRRHDADKAAGKSQGAGS